jgi:hypothetical protein
MQRGTSEIWLIDAETTLRLEVIRGLSEIVTLGSLTGWLAAGWVVRVKSDRSMSLSEVDCGLVDWYW